MTFNQVNDTTVSIQAKEKKLELTIHTKNVTLELGTDKSKYCFPYPALKAYPIILNVANKNNEPRQIIEFTYRIIQ